MVNGSCFGEDGLHEVEEQALKLRLKKLKEVSLGGEDGLEVCCGC